MKVRVVLTVLFLGLCLTWAACAVAGQTPPPSNDLVVLAGVDEGYQPLFKEDLSDATCEPGGWAFEQGVLTAKGNGNLWTKNRYGDFILDLEFKCDPETNSGVLLRCASIVNWLNTSIEVQILQPNDTYPNDKWHCGAIFDCLAPSQQRVKRVGEWNRCTIIAKANRIYVMLNDQWVIDMDLDKWTEPHKNPDGTANKFDNTFKDLSREGHIGLEYHGHPVWFRNLRIKPLPKAK